MDMIDIYSTFFMEQLIREKPTLFTFMRDRYFGAGNVTAFKTEKVIVDYDDGAGNLMAPFVVPRVGSVPFVRTGYETRELVPPYIAPSRPLSVDDTLKRQAGESIVGGMTPEQRAAKLLAEDLDFLDKTITRREEWMAVNTMMDNACTMTHIGDNGEKGYDLTAQYYTDGKNDGVFTADTPWEIGTESKRGTWFDGVVKQIESLTEAGREVTDLVLGTEVYSMILNDPWVLKMLDNRRVNIGSIDPRWQANGVTTIGTLNFDGVELNIFCYRGTYQQRTMVKQKLTLTTDPYFPTKGALLAAPGTGKMLYGAVTQMEMDNQLHTRTGTRIPKHVADVKHNQRESILTSRPIATPTIKSPWRACRNVLG